MTFSSKRENENDHLSEGEVEDINEPGNVVSQAPLSLESLPADDRQFKTHMKDVQSQDQKADTRPANAGEQEEKQPQPLVQEFSKEQEDSSTPKQFKHAGPDTDIPGQKAHAEEDIPVEGIPVQAQKTHEEKGAALVEGASGQEGSSTPKQFKHADSDTDIPGQKAHTEKEDIPVEGVPVQAQKTREEKGVALVEEASAHRVMLQEREIRKALVEDFAEFERSKEAVLQKNVKRSSKQEAHQSAALTENVVLYRGQHFYVRTTVSPDKKRSAHPLRKPTGHTAMVPKVIPNQKERVAERETRLMPVIDVVDFVPRKRRLYLPAWFEIAYVALGMIISVILHAYNMFNYPLYEMDEGTYMSAAWAVLNGKIYPYAYGYGHPPFAWMQLAGLVQLIGGLFLFGNAINTGRVIMLLYTVCDTLLVYLIARKMSGSRLMALLSMVLFAYSPLAVTYQRLVLLDNIATFWFLLSLYLLVISRSKLRYTILSAICLGLSVLSKEVLALVMPAMVYGVWLYTTRFQRKFALVAFIYAFAAVVSLWVLMAVLKGELFPQGWLPWDKHQHLSFIGTFLQQTQRGQNQGSFSAGWKAWYGTDPLFMMLGLAAMAFNVIIGWWKRNHLFLALLAISYWLLLVRGGVVFPFYFIPLIPIMALNSAMMVHTIADWLGHFVRLDMFRVFLIYCVLGFVVVFFAMNSQLVYHDDVTSEQTQAMNWVSANIPRDSYVIMNSYMYTDLRVPGGAAVGSGSVFPNAEVYINIATDPTLLAEVGQNWDRVDYIIADSQIEQYITSNQLPSGAMFMRQALYAAGYPNSPCAVFKSPGYEIHVWCVKHTNPKPVASSAPIGS
ncbi:MAG TPA: phospholipid carrier-dependent glycosyltransferase, partial [Ktedonobacteraceae bacterium]